jgi:hypothetical protein
MTYPIRLLTPLAALSSCTLDMKTIRVAALSASALMAMAYPSPSWAEEWDVAITHVVGTPQAGNKHFTGINGAIGTNRGQQF